MANTTLKKHPAQHQQQRRETYALPFVPRILPEAGLAQSLHQWDALQPAGELHFPMLADRRFRTSGGLTPLGYIQEDGLCLPPVNVRELDEAFVVDVFLPRANRKDITIDVRNGSALVVQAERSQEFEQERQESEYLRREMSVRGYYRSFILPIEVKREDITARYQDGVLEITLPKTPEAKASTFAVPIRG